MYPTALQVGEVVILKRKSSEKQIKAFVKEVIMQPTNHTGVYHSGVYDIHGFGEMFGDHIHRTGETISESQMREEEELLTA